jgi:H+-translocating NAD(P) transhydrogenase subunit alpha
VKSMKKGSVIVDLAAENGGNCALTQPGSVVQQHGVHIIGYIDLPSRLAPTASVLYGNNLAYLLEDLGGAENFHIDLDDEVVRQSLVVHEGNVVWPPPRTEPPPAPAKAAVVASPVAADTQKPKSRVGFALTVGIAALALWAIGFVAPPAFLSHLTVFVLAVIVGWQVVWNVTPALHTPLMSVTNAISGIIVVGGMLTVSGPPGSPAVILGAVAILLASINIAGGFLVTQRMLRMFRR